MLAILGPQTVRVLGLVPSRTTTPLEALIVAPVATALVGGFGLGIGPFIVTGLEQTTIRRDESPQLAAFNFVLRRVPRDSVTQSRALDAHGKSRSSVWLDLEMPGERGR